MTVCGFEMTKMAGEIIKNIAINSLSLQFIINPLNKKNKN